MLKNVWKFVEIEKIAPKKQNITNEVLKFYPKMTHADYKMSHSVGDIVMLAT